VFVVVAISSKIVFRGEHLDPAGTVRIVCGQGDTIQRYIEGVSSQRESKERDIENGSGLITLGTISTML
jgi:hypothetical protein